MRSGIAVMSEKLIRWYCIFSTTNSNNDNTHICKLHSVYAVKADWICWRSVPVGRQHLFNVVDYVKKGEFWRMHKIWLPHRSHCRCTNSSIQASEMSCPPTALPPVGHIWDVMLVWRKGNINENCLCITVLCTIIMVHKDTSSSYRLVACIGLWSCLV